MIVRFKYLFLLTSFLTIFYSCAEFDQDEENNKINNLLNKGRSEYLIGNYDKSFEHFQNLISSYEQKFIKCCEVEVLESYTYIGGIYEKLGEFTSAEENYRKAYHLAKDYDNIFYQKTSLNNLSYIENSLPVIKELINKGIEIGDDPESQGNIHLKYRYAKILAEQGESEDAKNLFIELKNIKSSNSENYNISFCYKGLGIVHKFLGEFELSVEKFDSALIFFNKLPKEMTALSDKNSILIEKVEALISLKDYNNAIHKLNEVYQYAEQSNDIVLKLRVKENYLKIYQEKKEYNRSIGVMNEIRRIDSYISEQLGSIKGVTLKNIKHQNELKNQKAKTTYLILSIFLLSLIYYLYSQFHRKKAQVKLLEKQQELKDEQAKRKDLQNQLELESINAFINGQEEERKRYATQLHDSLGANLAAVNMHLSVLKKDVSQTSYNRVSNMLKNAIEETRNISHSIMPPVLVNQGLIASINEKALEWDCEQLQFEVDSNLERAALDDKLEITLYRGILECINNVMKHAKASKVNISFTQKEDKRLYIAIQDNGVGFKVDDLTKGKGGLGINGLRLRTKYFGGQFNIQSERGKGTVVHINVPILTIKKTG